MKILELANKLKKVYDQHGDIDVMFAGPNNDQSIYAVEDAVMLEASKDEYPEDWNMPAGYKFVQLIN
jgi:hypothetical protein